MQFTDLPEEIHRHIDSFAAIGDRVQLSRTNHYFKALAKIVVARSNELVILNPHILISKRVRTEKRHRTHVSYHAYTDSCGKFHRIIYKYNCRDEEPVEIIDSNTPVYFGVYNYYGHPGEKRSLVICKDAVSGSYVDGGMIEESIKLKAFVTEDEIKEPWLGVSSIFVDNIHEYFVADGYEDIYICPFKSMTINRHGIKYTDMYDNIHTMSSKCSVHGIDDHYGTTCKECLLFDPKTGNAIHNDNGNCVADVFMCQHLEILPATPSDNQKN